MSNKAKFDIQTEATRIEIGKIGDCIVNFAIWTDRRIAIKTLASEGRLVPAVKIQCGNCHAIVGLNQEIFLSNRAKLEGCIVWTAIGDNSKSATSKAQIARFISELPEHTYVKDFTTLDQLYHWMEWKNDCIWIAKCFLAGDKERDNPLFRELEEGIIDCYYYNKIWLTVDLYDNLWKLIHIKYKVIKAAFIKQGWEYFFKSPYELLEQIIFCTINGEFLNILKPRYVSHAGDFKKIAKLGRKNNLNSLSAKDRELLTKLTEKHSQRNIWYERLLAVGEFLARGDSFIQVRMNIHREIMDGIAALQMDAACKPELKRHGQISYTWENGIKRIGIKPGWKA